MNRHDFAFDLPPELIAQTPLPERAASRLLVLDGATGGIEDREFPDLVELLRPGDLLVLNDTRVLPARVMGRKASGGQVEMLLERITEPTRARVHLRVSRSPKPGHEILFPGGVRAVVESRAGALFELCFDREVQRFLIEHGQVPLPPYIDRPPEESDRGRYQTVFARAPGAVAAPTAGLHFDEALFARLEQRGVERAFLTLHVGAGTFSPVRTERVEDHRLHPEWLKVSPELCAQVAAAQARGGRVVAVGTTAVRSLETAARGGVLEPFEGESSLFIYPGYAFKIVDAIVTNFHLPESSLLMLVAAFAGREQTLAAYRHAVAGRYRFFSYGDAMFVTPMDPRASEAGRQP